MTFETWLQSRLTAHGFSVGPIDGIVGPLTTGAIKAFERARGLPVDGLADAAGRLDTALARLERPLGALIGELGGLLDDGADDIEEAATMLGTAADDGAAAIVITPHGGFRRRWQSLA